MHVFDIIGPVMIGPSSSHTAGAARIGYAAVALLGERPVRAHIRLHGSFSKTYRGHGTDRALIAGILGLSPDDGRIRTSLALANERGLAVEWALADIEDAHPNTALITLTGESGRQISVQGSSVGGGGILITHFCGMDVVITGERPTLIIAHRDAPGAIAAVTECLADCGMNIASFRLSRESKGGQAVMTIETDSQPAKGVCPAIEKLPGILSVTLLLAMKGGVL